MLLISLSIFTFTGAVFLATVNHLGNTGKVFLGLKQVAVGLAMLIPVALALGLLVSPSSRPAKSAIAPVETSGGQDDYLLRLSRTNKILSKYAKPLIAPPVETVESSGSEDHSRTMSQFRKIASQRAETKALLLDNSRMQANALRTKQLNDAKRINYILSNGRDSEIDSPRYSSSGKVTTVTTKD